MQRGASQKIITSSRRQESDTNLSTKSLTAQATPIDGLNQAFSQRYHPEKEMKLQGVVPRKILEGDINGGNTKNNLSKMLKLIELQPTLNSTVGNGQELSLQNITLANKDKSVSQCRSKAEAESAMCRFDTGRAIIIVRQAHTKLPANDRNTVTNSNEEESNGWNSAAQTKAATLNDSTVVRHKINNGATTSGSCSDELIRRHYSNNQYAEGGQVPSLHENRFPLDFELEWGKDQCNKYKTKALLQNTWLSSRVTIDKDCQKDFSKIHVRPAGLCINSNTESLTSTVRKLWEQSSRICSKEDGKAQGSSNDSQEKRLSASIVDLDERANFKYLAHICSSAKISESNNYLEGNIAESTNNNKGNDNPTNYKTVNIKEISHSKDIAGAKTAHESCGSIGFIEDEQYSTETHKPGVCQEVFFYAEQGKDLNADKNCASSTNTSSKRLLKKGDANESLIKYVDVEATRYSTGMMAGSVASQVPATESHIKVSKMEPCEEHMDKVDVHRRMKRPFEFTHMEENDSRYLTRTSKAKHITGKMPPEILTKKRGISP